MMIVVTHTTSRHTITTTGAANIVVILTALSGTVVGMELLVRFVVILGSSMIVVMATFATVTSVEACVVIAVSMTVVETALVIEPGVVMVISRLVVFSVKKFSVIKNCIISLAGNDA